MKGFEPDWQQFKDTGELRLRKISDHTRRTKAVSKKALDDIFAMVRECLDRDEVENWDEDKEDDDDDEK
jgi:hypothetical protein